MPRNLYPAALGAGGLRKRVAGRLRALQRMALGERKTEGGGLRYARRTDANHLPVKATFEKLLPGHVTDSSAWGAGAGDLFISVGAYCCFVEIKVDAKAKLTKAQIEFRKKHDSVHFRCEDADQAISLCGYIRRQAERLAA